MVYRKIELEVLTKSFLDIIKCIFLRDGVYYNQNRNRENLRVVISGQEISFGYLQFGLMFNQDNKYIHLNSINLTRRIYNRSWIYTNEIIFKGNFFLASHRINEIEKNLFNYFKNLPRNSIKRLSKIVYDFNSKPISLETINRFLNKMNRQFEFKLNGVKIEKFVKIKTKIENRNNKINKIFRKCSD